MIRLCPGIYFGSTTRVRTIAGFRMTATRYSPGTILPRHCHEQPYLVVALRGATVERALRRSHTCSRGWLVLNQAGEAHSDHVVEEGAEVLNIELPSAFLEAYGPRLRQCPVQYRHAGGSLPAVGTLEIAMASRDALAPLAVEESIATIIDSMASGPGGGTECGTGLDAVAELILDRRGIAPSLDSLATLAGLHPAHLCRQFRREYGRTITEFAASVRVHRALEEVLHSHRPLASISSSCGFSDQPHMTRMFRRFFGTTPARIRRESR